MKSFLKFIVIFFLLAPFLTNAVREIDSSGSFTAKISPANPAPGDRVVINLESYSFNLDGSSINWYLDNKVQKDYNNKKQFVFFAGKAGTSNEIKIIVISQKKQFSKTLIFEPAEVDLIWQAGTIVPAFYKGKALPSTESLIKILAIPHLIDSTGGKVSSENLSFRWYVNGNYVSNSSGVGKNTFITSAEKNLVEKTVGVLVSDPTSKLVAENKIVIKPNLPKILFYEIKPLEGINYSQNLKNSFGLTESETTIKAEPYFFALGRITPSSYSWFLNGQKISINEEDPSEITFRRKEETEGVSKIKLTVGNSKNSYQTASSFLTILFNNRTINFNDVQN